MTYDDTSSAIRRSLQRHRTANGWRRFLRLGVFLALLAYIPSRAGDAATVTTTFLVTANIAINCLISANELDFGDYQPMVGNLTAPLNGQTAITVSCTTGGHWVVGLDQGLFPGATVTTRQMTGPSNHSLQYSLFSDAARTVNWGNTIGVDTVSGTGAGGPQVVTVYGQVPAGQTSAIAGGYSDTITATITF